ncbi:PREDICTED: uncharacterized protein LOC104596230 [Nelumbo nucifera]|uniref:Uncharacterized protein LOC104596230 n=1 Tax=Nelumbo nucifera TaxID=4432 RepID=A0A1U8A341_NELNU|nr:PREDICTED: uncharacterized protein LOC104596230 [Nelumbo nucifera]
MGIKPKGNAGTSGGTGKKEVICEYCKKPKHTKDKCWKLHPNLVPIGFQKKHDSKRSGSANVAAGPDEEMSASAQLAAMGAEYEKFGKMNSQLGDVTSPSNSSGNSTSSAFTHSGSGVSEGDWEWP